MTTSYPRNPFEKEFGYLDLVPAGLMIALRPVLIFISNAASDD